MIDWAFISAREGGQYLTGYVPDPTGSRSGVTIATGFDLGGRTVQSLRQMLGANHPVIGQLIPYLGLTGQAAETALTANPLTISQAHADDIDRAAKQDALNRLRTQYNLAIAQENARRAQTRPPTPPLAMFDLLPDRAQTVIASVTFQYGTPWIRTPTFWGHAVQQDWAAVIRELRNFGDRYPSRRNIEADYLLPLVTP